MFKTETLTHVQNMQNCGSGGRSTDSLERYYYSTHMAHPTLLYYILIPVKQKLINEWLMSTCNYIILGGLCACSVHTCPAFGLIVSHCNYLFRLYLLETFLTHMPNPLYRLPFSILIRHDLSWANTWRLYPQ